MYRLLPRRRGVWRRLERLLEAQRQLYNAAPPDRGPGQASRCDAWRLAGLSIGWQDQFRSLTVCRRELPEMAADPVVVQRGTLKRLDEAMKGFFRRAQAGQRPGFPRFRGRRGFDSLCFVSGVRLVPACPDPFRVSRGGAGARLRLPGFGLLAVRRRGGNPHAHGAPVSAVLKREAGKRYAIVCFRVDAPVREDDGRVVGVDMNAGRAAAVGPGLRSGGVLFHAPDARRLEARARVRARLAKTRRRMAGMRRDWRHHVSRALAGAAHTVAVEDLRMRDMTASARGPAEGPGLPGPAEGRAQPGRARHRLGGAARHARL